MDVKGTETYYITANGKIVGGKCFFALIRR